MRRQTYGCLPNRGRYRPLPDADLYILMAEARV